MIVGESVNDSSGSTSSAASGSRAFARSSASSSGGNSQTTSSRKRSALGMSAFGRAENVEDLDHRSRLHEGVVGNEKIRSVAAAPTHVHPEGRAHCLADAQR